MYNLEQLTIKNNNLNLTLTDNEGHRLEYDYELKLKEQHLWSGIKPFYPLDSNPGSNWPMFSGYNIKHVTGYNEL